MGDPGGEEDGMGFGWVFGCFFVFDHGFLGYLGTFFYFANVVWVFLFLFGDGTRSNYRFKIDQCFCRSCTRCTKS